jgi:hypothetical protein
MFGKHTNYLGRFGAAARGDTAHAQCLPLATRHCGGNLQSEAWDLIRAWYLCYTLYHVQTRPASQSASKAGACERRTSRLACRCGLAAASLSQDR